MQKYLDSTGLSYLWGKIKSLFADVVYHESDDGTSGEASIPSSDANIIEVVKVNGDPLTPDANKAVDIQVPTSLSQLSPDSTHRVVTDTEKTTWNNKGTYTKPSGGIPASDLEDGVIPDVSGFYTKPSGGIPAQDIASGVIPIVPTKLSDFIDDLGENPVHSHSDYLVEHQDISGKAEKSEMIVTDGVGVNIDKITIQLKSGTSATVIKSHQSLSGYLKFVLCADEAEYNAIQNKDSGTLYLIPES